MDNQLGTLTLQELSLKRECTSIEQVVKIHALGDWETKVKEYLADSQAGIESLNAVPQNEEERREIFEIKRQIVSTLVKRVTINCKRILHVEISLNLLNIIQDDIPEGIEGKNKGQIKTAGIHPGWRYFFQAARTLQCL